MLSNVTTCAEESEAQFKLNLLILFGLVLLVCLSRLFFHKIHVSRWIPESGVIVLEGTLLGLILGGIVLGGAKIDILEFNQEFFFFALIPPIIWEAGYVMNKDYFFKNLGLVMTYAITGTLLNTLFTGILLYCVSDTFSSDMKDLELRSALAFGALISAVDPVGVLAIFEEANVNETLNMLVFGESVLNDAVSIVFYDLFVSLPSTSGSASVNYGSIVLGAIGDFLIAFLGGMLVGIFLAAVSAYCCKWASHKMEILIPMFVFLFAYISYVFAELCGEISSPGKHKVSGIVAILFCGMCQEHWVEPNMSKDTHHTLHNIMKLIASTAETVIFMFLGIFSGTLIVYQIKPPVVEEGHLSTHNFDWPFIMWTLFIIFIGRFTFTYFLTTLANLKRTDKISYNDQFVLAYGGIRGGIAFALSLKAELDAKEEHEEGKSPPGAFFVAATIIVVWFTMFVQGCTVKPILNFLRTARAKGLSESQAQEHVLGSFLRPTARAIDAIAGKKGGMARYFRLADIDNFVKRFVIRDLISEERELIVSLQSLRHNQAKVDEHAKKFGLTTTAPTEGVRCQTCHLRALADNREISTSRLVQDPEFREAAGTRDLQTGKPLNKLGASADLMRARRDELAKRAGIRQRRRSTHKKARPAGGAGGAHEHLLEDDDDLEDVPVNVAGQAFAAEEDDDNVDSLIDQLLHED